jgi:SagB-type dehydrogenase family enzyme
MTSDAAAVFIWAAIPYRTEWKYAYLSPRMIAMEAGHVCQNLYLSAESIGAGACAMLAYDQASIDALIGVDGKDEFALYLACVGRLAKGED